MSNGKLPYLNLIPIRMDIETCMKNVIWILESEFEITSEALKLEIKRNLHICNLKNKFEFISKHELAYLYQV